MIGIFPEGKITCAILQVYLQQFINILYHPLSFKRMEVSEHFLEEGGKTIMF